MARLSFVKWLHQQALHDPDRSMPYARAYEIGPLIESVIGIEGEFSLDKLSLAVRETYDDAFDQMEYIEALVTAESTWRIDGVIDEAPVPPTKPKRARKAASKTEPKPLVDDKPVKADFTCGYRGTDGRNCPHKAVAGTARCEMHGGAITDPDVRRSILLSSYARIMEGSGAAVAALIDIVNDSRNDLARVQAARELLDRAGLVQDQHVHLHTAEAGDEGGALTELRSRLDEIRARLSTPLGEIAAAPATPVSKESLDSTIIDAEIVS